MQLQPLSTGNFYATRVETRGGFFLSFQYQLIARDHKSLQCDLGNILKQNKCILCVPRLFKKRDCLLSLFSRCRKNSKFDYRRVLETFNANVPYGVIIVTFYRQFLYSL